MALSGHDGGDRHGSVGTALPEQEGNGGRRKRDVTINMLLGFCNVLAKASTAPPKPRAPPPLSFRHLPTYGECFELALVASCQWNYGGDVVGAAVLLGR